MAEQTPPTCGCGMDLYEWRWSPARRGPAGCWAADLEDVTRSHQEQPTRHDVLNSRGQRLRTGTCQSAQGG